MRTLLIALLATGQLAAQQPATDAIPRELALALIDRYGPPGTRAEIIVGQVPPSFPDNALPHAGVSVLGGVERSPGASVAVALSQSPDPAFAALVRHLERARWRAVDRGRIEGFVPTHLERQHSFCRDDVFLSVTVRERPNGGSLAHLSSWRSPEDRRCDENGRAHRGALDRPELPVLHAPGGARMLGGGGGGGGRESRDAFTRLETSLHSIDLAAHYATQLARAGWTITGPTTGEGIVAYSVRHRDAEKRVLAGVLMVMDIPGSEQREVLLRVAREQRRR